MPALLSEAQVEDILSVPEGTIEVWRGYAYGPAYIELTRGCIRYRQVDVENFFYQQRRSAGGQPIQPWTAVA